MTTNRKAAGVCNHPQTAQETQRNVIFSSISPESNKLASLVSMLAARGHDLSRIDAEPPRYYMRGHGGERLDHLWVAVKTLLAHIVRSA